MSVLSFEWLGIGSLESALKSPINRVSIDLDRAGRPAHMLTFWRADGMWINIYSKMHDVAFRLEVGVLTFDAADKKPADQIFVDVSKTPLEPMSLQKLVIDESGISAESGVVLNIRDHRPLIIVAGAFPCTLAIDGLIDLPHIFEPEYRIEKYRRVVM